MSRAHVMPKRTRSTAGANAIKLGELGLAVPQVVAHRLARMALAGPVPSARDSREFTGMVLEKQIAFAQAWIGMYGGIVRLQQRFLLACFTGRVPSGSAALGAVAAKGLAPIHRKAVGNARRLARTRLR